MPRCLGRLGTTPKSRSAKRAQANKAKRMRDLDDSDPESPSGQDGVAELSDPDEPFSSGTERLVQALKATGKGKSKSGKTRKVTFC